jgi:uncharacterized LabA/DUF88 family protein
MANRTIWLIDGAYLMRSAPGRFDYLRLRQEVEKALGRVDEAYYLNSIQEETQQLLSFHTWLKSAPPKGPKIRVQLYRTKDLDFTCPCGCGVRSQRTVQKGVDVGLATLMLKLAHQNRYDRLILAAGDGDFEDALRHLTEELHKEVHLVGFPDTISADLQSYADSVFWLSEVWSAIRREGGPL